MIRDTLYYFQCIVFLVEGQLFKVPRNYFAAKSPVFSDVFSLPPVGEQADGFNDDQPFELRGIKKADFQSLLKVLHPMDFKPLTSAEWTSVLRLSTMWELAEVREKAIAELSLLMPSDFHHLLFDKIMLAKECKVRQWLIDGYVELVVRQRIISVEEAEVLGWETAARLLRVREEFRIDPPASSTLPVLPPPTLNACTCETCVVPKTPRTFGQQRREIIEREFENELKYMTP